MASTKQSSRKSVLKEVATIGLDLAKTKVYFVGLDATGEVLTRRLYSKDRLLETTAKMAHPNKQESLVGSGLLQQCDHRPVIP